MTRHQVPWQRKVSVIFAEPEVLLLVPHARRRAHMEDEEQGIEQGLPSGARMVAAEATTQTRGGTLL